MTATAAELIRNALEEASLLLETAVHDWSSAAHDYPVRARQLVVCRLAGGKVAEVKIEEAGGLRIGTTVHHYLYSAMGAPGAGRALSEVLADAQRILAGAQRVKQRIERICEAAKAEWITAVRQANTVAGRALATVVSARFARDVKED